MANYWLSFTVHNGDRPKGTYKERRDHIYNTAKGGLGLLTRPIWSETTSYILFQAGDDIDVVGRSIAKGLDGEVDLFLIGKVGFKSERYWGAIVQPTTMKSFYPTMIPLK